ncbi:hypothetical protein ILYODFUR_009294 [Ilyodon furcidens]|uniref:Uncharacterized protein n=1 Tax=Ilyodon furcidens TaxID=33524 RepID=A0ABV0VF99_9TELE
MKSSSFMNDTGPVELNFILPLQSVKFCSWPDLPGTVQLSPIRKTSPLSPLTTISVLMCVRNTEYSLLGCRASGEWRIPRVESVPG